MKKVFYVTPMSSMPGGLQPSKERIMFHFESKSNGFYCVKEQMAKEISPKDFQKIFFYEGDDVNEMIKEYEEFCLLSEIIE